MAIDRFGFDSEGFRSIQAHGGEGEIDALRLPEELLPDAAHFLDLAVVPVGATIGFHAHAPHEQEIYIVVSGVGRMQVDDEEIGVSAGDVIVNPPGASHAFVNTGDTEVRLVVLEVEA